jgi:hypothetical protein
MVLQTLSVVFEKLFSFITGLFTPSTTHSTHVENRSKAHAQHSKIEQMSVFILKTD